MRTIAGEMENINKPQSIRMTKMFIENLNLITGSLHVKNDLTIESQLLIQMPMKNKNLSLKFIACFTKKLLLQRCG